VKQATWQWFKLGLQITQASFFTSSTSKKSS